MLREAKVSNQVPSALLLSDLAKVAREMGWLGQRVADEWVNQALNGLRSAVAHPGAFVRGKRALRDSDPTFDIRDPALYSTAFEIVSWVCQAVAPQRGGQ